MYNRVLLKWKTASESSKRQQIKVMLSGFFVKSARLYSDGLSNQSLKWSWINLQAKWSLPWKYFLIKLLESSLVNPTISHSVSQYGLISIPSSWREVMTMWQAGKSLLWTSDRKISCLQESASSKPSSRSRTLDSFSLMYLKKVSLASLSISRGRIWSSIASSMLVLISLHRSKSSTSISGKDSSHSSCLFAQSYASFCE